MKAVFRQHAQAYSGACREILRGGSSTTLDEAAFPAYADRNPLIHWLFWERIRRATIQIASGGRVERILDFGCGGGALLPLIAPFARELLAADIDLGPLQRISEYLPMPENLRALDLTADTLESIGVGSVDAIVALDVLEHVPDLKHTVASLFQLLRPGGVLLVSGPTENLAYRIGRRLAGAKYSGAYHVRDVHQIREVIAESADVEILAKLPVGMPLFHILRAVTP